MRKARVDVGLRRVSQSAGLPAAIAGTRLRMRGLPGVDVSLISHPFECELGVSKFEQAGFKNDLCAGSFLMRSHQVSARATFYFRHTL